MRRGKGESVRSSRLRALVGAGLLALGALPLGALPGWAQEGPVSLSVMVSHISDAEGSIDPRASRLHDKIRKQLKYSSLRVLEDRTLRLALDEVGRVELPNGRAFRVRPGDVGDGGVLLAVDVEGATKADMRVPSGHLVVLGAGSYEGGTLVISLEPRF